MGGELRQACQVGMARRVARMIRRLSGKGEHLPRLRQVLPWMRQTVHAGGKQVCRGTSVMA
jgi:hypothetical protein